MGLSAPSSQGTVLHFIMMGGVYMAWANIPMREMYGVRCMSARYATDQPTYRLGLHITDKAPNTGGHEAAVPIAGAKTTWSSSKKSPVRQAFLLREMGLGWLYW
jgi:hypothetical protein